MRPTKRDKLMPVIQAAKKFVGTVEHTLDYPKTSKYTNKDIRILAEHLLLELAKFISCDKKNNAVR